MRAATAFLALLLMTANVAAQSTLERVVIVERHGVRPPTKAAADLAKYAQSPWPQWPVAPGELTAHGAAAMALMGEAIRHTYENRGLMAAGACPTGVFVWSDSGDQRTRASGDALLKGFGCARPSQHLNDGIRDPLFSGSDAKLCRPADAKQMTEERLRETLAANRAAYETARRRLQAVLTPDGCGKSGQPVCTVGDGENSVITGKNGELRLEGPLSVAATMAENLLLEYSEGMPLNDVGWGNGAAALSEVMVLHRLYADVTRRNLVYAAPRGSRLAQQIVDLLNGRSSAIPDAAPVPGDAKLVVFLGHDTNLSNLSGFLGTPWTLPGQPDATAPGAALAFELWRAADGSKSVRIKVLYQIPDDTRLLRAGMHEQPVALSGCPDGICTLAELTKRMETSVAPACLAQ